MNLRPYRNVTEVGKTHPRFAPAERGGLVGFVERSGLDFVDYFSDPSGIRVIGVQMDDVVFFDSSEFPRPRYKPTRDLFEPMNLILGGEIETNFIHPDSTGQIYSGRVAYAGPSGLFTHDSSFGGTIVGIFISDLVLDEQEVMVQGGSFERDIVVFDSDGTYSIDKIGYPERRVTTPGWARVLLDIQWSP